MKHNQNGAANGLMALLLLTVVLLVIALCFGIWAFSSGQKYKNTTNQKVATAVVTAKQQQTATDQAIFTQQENSPLATYNGPEAYGSIVLQYPKSWSGYVDASGQSGDGALIDGYFNPGIVPGIEDQNSSFALRLQVINDTYADSLQQLTADQQAGQITVSPYALPKVPNVVGVEATGQINNVTETLIALPVRTETLEVWTEGTQYLGIFNSDILPNLSFSP